MVAPFTGAWIETARPILSWRKRKVAPFTGAWIETANPAARPSSTQGRSLHGGVDRNIIG